MIDDSNVDEFLRPILEGRLSGAAKYIAKGKIKKIAKSGLRKKPVQYPADWRGPVGKGGQFARKADLAAAKAGANRSRAKDIARGPETRTSPRKSSGGAAGRAASDTEKAGRTRSAISRAARGEGSNRQNRRDIGNAAKAESQRTDRTGDTKTTNPKSATDASKAADKADRAKRASIRGFSGLNAWSGRKVAAGGDQDLKNALSKKLEAFSNEYGSSTDPNEIRAAFKNTVNSLKEEINGRKISAEKKRALQAELKELIAEARSALDRDIANKSAIKKGSGGKGAGAGATRTRTVKGGPNKGAKKPTRSDAASQGQPRTAVGDRRLPAGTAGTAKRKRFPGPRPIDVPKDREGSVVGKDGKLQPPSAATKKKMADIRDREARRKGIAKPKKKKTTKKKTRESFINDLVNEVINLDNV